MAGPDPSNDRAPAGGFGRGAIEARARRRRFVGGGPLGDPFE